MYRLPIPEIIAQLDVARPPCVSIYLSIEPTEPEAARRERFQQLILRVESELSGAPEGSALLDELHHRRGLWSEPGLGQALFLSPTLQMSSPLFSRTRDSATVGERFLVTPLLREDRLDRPFYLLDVSLEHVRVARGNASGLEPIPLRGLPRKAEVSPETRALEAQWGNGSLARAVPTPRGVEHDVPRFLDSIEKHLLPILDRESLPLVLAAPPDLHGQVRHRFRDHCLKSGGLVGNFAQQSLSDLHSRTWGLIHSEIEREKRDLRERFRLAAAKALAAQGFEPVAAAHREGRIETMLVQDTSESDDPCDVRADEIRRVAALAEQRVRQGGDVVFFSHHEMPVPEIVAAILRW